MTLMGTANFVKSVECDAIFAQYIRVVFIVFVFITFIRRALHFLSSLSLQEQEFFFGTKSMLYSAGHYEPVLEIIAP